MPYKNGNMVWNETIWKPWMIAFLKKNFKRMTNPQLAKALCLRLTTTRTMLYKLGLKRMELQYWTPEQIKFLKCNYKKIGDLELAEIFQSKWKKKKGWSKKHIEKKRKYLGLKRTRKQIIAVGQRNLDQGRLNTHSRKGKTNWLTTGPAKQKEIRMYRSKPGLIQARIKIGKRWVFWPRWAYIQKHGPIAAGLVVIMKDGNPFNTKLSNLELVSRAESTRRAASRASTTLADNYVASLIAYGDPILREAVKKNPVLISTHRDLLLLKRKIKTLKYERKQRSAAAA